MRKVIHRANLHVQLFGIGIPLTSIMQLEAQHISETSLFTFRCTGCHNPWTQYALLQTTWMRANVGKMLQPDTPQPYSGGIYSQYYHVWAVFTEGARCISVLTQNRNMSTKRNCNCFIYVSAESYLTIVQYVIQCQIIAVLDIPFKIASTVELHLSGLIGTASHPDMQKIRII